MHSGRSRGADQRDGIYCDLFRSSPLRLRRLRRLCRRMDLLIHKSGFEKWCGWTCWERSMEEVAGKKGANDVRSLEHEFKMWEIAMLIVDSRDRKSHYTRAVDQISLVELLPLFWYYLCESRRCLSSIYMLQESSRCSPLLSEDEIWGRHNRFIS